MPGTEDAEVLTVKGKDKSKVFGGELGVLCS